MLCLSIKRDVSRTSIKYLSSYGKNEMTDEFSRHLILTVNHICEVDYGGIIIN